ncbi:MAG: hypothetical protein QOJ89_117 [bacterium]
MSDAFKTMRGSGGQTRAIVFRRGLDADGAAELLDAVAAVRWSDLYHAYGPAADVAMQLRAVIVGDEGTREEAWWNLFGNIHHQGTIYEATVPAVPILLGLADWVEYPDRALALMMLREIAAADGVHVWRYGSKDELVTLVDDQRRLYPLLRAALRDGAARLLDGWRDEEPAIRRALLWLLSALPELHERYAALVADVLPARHRHAWELEVSGSAESESESDGDAIFALEDWVHTGVER